ncbi:TetR/AcrR family transcriptional regulator C-terminal domain-containing protein [Streptomyces sp. NPDC004726]
MASGGRGGPADEEVRSFWLRPQREPRGEQPLTRGRIVGTALALLDEEGIDGLTMRRLAQRLSISAPSLYWHVQTKDDVLDLAVDTVFTEVSTPPAGAGRDWRGDVTALMRAWRAALLRHPWATAVPARRRPAIGPAFLSGMEYLQATLARAGFSGKALSAATWALYNHVMGSTSTQSALRITDAERRAGQERLHAARDRYPTLAANGYLYDDDWDGSFTDGLEYLLDGLQAQLNVRPPA